MENRKNTILIVDDTDYNIELLTHVFKESCRILTAKNGRLALEVMRRYADRIDAVLLDIVMPEMDGYQVLLDMGMDEKLKHLPVIVITADDDPESEYKAFDYGAYDFITRPFNIKTVKQRVDALFHRRELERIHSEHAQLVEAAETEKRLSALMENLPGGVAIIETDGKKAECTYYNSAVPKLFRKSDEEFLADFASDKTEMWVEEFIEKAQSGRKFDYSFSVKDKNDSTCWIRMIASSIDEGQKDDKKSLYCVFLDINAEKMYELHAAEADARLKQNGINIEKLINNAPGGIALCEKAEGGKMKVLYSSKGLADILGYPDYETYLNDTESGIHKIVSDIDSSIFKTKMNSAIATGQPFEYTFQCRSYMGMPLWILVRAQFVKSNMGRLRLYCFISDVTKEKEYEIELKNSAYYDSLTGLYNRGAFFVNAREILNENPETDYVIYVMNIGNFKVINDIMGREIGDRVLVSVAAALNKIIPNTGIFSRLFADNFAIMIPNDVVFPEEIIDEVYKEVEDSCLVGQDMHYYIGVYYIAERHISIEDLCDRAAIACRSVTGSFTNHVAYYDSKMREAMLEEQEIRDETTRAVVKGEFSVYYQPIYSMKLKKFVSGEALVRWIHPTKGIVPSSKFIPVFEKNGFIAELDLYVLEQVCKYHQRRERLGLDRFPISVNISRMTLFDPNLYDMITRLTEKYGVPPEYFRIEITETAYNDNPAHLLETVKKLREKGFSVLLDDFGSGNSSLNTLKDMPLDMMKLDLKFMKDFENNERVGTIVTAFARMARWINVPLLAEGVETKEQYEYLQSIGCAYAQGYYFSKPITESQFTKLIAEEHVTTSETVIEKYEPKDDITDIIGNNPTFTKLIGGVFGGLGIYEMNGDDLEIIRVNDGYSEIMGEDYDEHSDSHYNVWKNMPEEDAEKSKAACIEAVNTGKAVKTMIRRYGKDGRLLYLDGVHRRLGGTDENPIICIAFNDVTEQREIEHHLEDVVASLDGGIALLTENHGEVELSYASDNFLSLLCLDPENRKEVQATLRRFLNIGCGIVDINVNDKENNNRIVCVHLSEVKTHPGYIAFIKDVTEERAKGKDRLTERMTYASAGIYDEIYRVNYNRHTVQLVDSMRNPEKAEESKEVEINKALERWTEKYIHSVDRADVLKFFKEPETNADFTEKYLEIRIIDKEAEDSEDKARKYKRLSMVMVRYDRDICMLFTKSIDEHTDATLSVSANEIDRLYKMIAEQTDTTVIEYDHFTDTIECSPSIKNFAIGTFSQNKIKNKNQYVAGTVVHPDDKKIYDDFIQQTLETEKMTYVTVRLKMADGDYKWCRLSVSFIKNSEKKIVRSLCTINIVDDEVQALRKLDQSEKMLARTVKHIPVGIGVYSVVNGNPKPIYVSDTTYRVFGAEPGDGLDPEVYFNFSRGKQFEAGAEDDYTFLTFKKNGSSFWLNVKYKVRDEGGRTYIYAAVSDVSYKVSIERAKTIQNQLYQLLLDETGTIIFDYDIDEDQITCYHHSSDNIRLPDVLKPLHEKIEELVLLDGSNRHIFLETLDSLTKKKGIEELPLMIEVDGYRRHYRCMFKSIDDMDGKIFRIIGKVEDVEDEIARLEEIRSKAMYDYLCVDIYNKATTEEFIRNELKHSTGGALLMIDVDDFKSINDRLGHLFGDEFLKKFATMIKSVFRESDIVGRYGGDEFFVFLNHASAAAAVKKGEAILKKVEQIQVPDIGQVKCSIGVASINPETREYVQLVRQADSALYEAKNRGKNCVVLFDPNTMSEAVFRTTEKENDSRNLSLSSNPNAEASVIMRVFSALHSSADLKTSINQMLALIGKHFDVSRAYIFEDSPDGLYCSNTYEWCGEGVSPEIDTLQNLSYEKDMGGEYHSSLNDDGILYCHDINTLSPSMKYLLMRQGIKSVLHCAIQEDGKFKGFVGFDECRSNRFWTQEQVDALAYVSKVLGTFLINDRNKHKTKYFSRSIETILYNYPEYVYIIDPKTRNLLYVNKMMEDLVGKDKLGTPCYTTICWNSENDSCPIKELLKKGVSTPVDMISPLLQSRVRAQATVVEWEGKPAYLINCIDVESLC